MKTHLFFLFSGFFFATRTALCIDMQSAPITQSCISCHGPKGISNNEIWPNLAGQKKTYLINQLQAFKKGDRYNDLMSPIARMLSDKDIQDIAEFFANLKQGDGK